MQQTSNPRQIIARLHDGLGNQLFIYAAARAIAALRGAELLIDSYSGFAHDHRYGALPQLQHFAVRAKTAPRNLCFPPPLGRQIRDIQKSLSKHLALRHRFIIREKDYESICHGAPLRPLVRLDGYWQSERYFKAISKSIAEEFEIVSPLSEKSIEIRDLIAAASQPVCLHVRQMHGAHHSFTQSPPAGTPQLPYTYYENAIERVVGRIDKPTFFCFSDNFDWIRERWKFPYPIYFVDHNRGSERAYEDMALMTQCRHFIVGNSTFSWWAAWLSKWPGKYIIAPSNTGGVKWGSEAALLPQEWDVLEI